MTHTRHLLVLSHIQAQVLLLLLTLRRLCWDALRSKEAPATRRLQLQPSIAAAGACCCRCRGAWRRQSGLDSLHGAPAEPHVLIVHAQGAWAPNADMCLS